MKVRVCLVVVLLSVLAVLAGCSLIPVRESKSDFENKRLIAADAVGLVAQVKELNPSQTVLFLGKKNQSDTFYKALRSELTRSGYSIRLSDETESPNVVSYSIIPVEATGADRQETYIVSVGGIDFKRTYRYTETGKPTPVGEWFVRGTDASDLTSNESLFDYSEQVVETDTSTESNIQIPAEPNPALASNTDVEEPAVARQPGVNAAVLNSVTRNLLDGSPSADAKYEHGVNVYEQILAFDEGSMALGRQNRELLRIIMGKYQSESDFIVLVGCSQGEFTEDSRSAKLAIGRTQSVRDELMKHGLSEWNIFSEGCWSTEVANQGYPEHGLVVTIKRDLNGIN